MPGTLDNQPNVVLPCEIHSLLYVFGTSSVNNIHRISLSTARECWNRETGVITPIISDDTHRIVSVPLRGEPSSLYSGAIENIESWLRRMTNSTWRNSFDEVSRNGPI